jgi:hypothetical protein
MGVIGSAVSLTEGKTMRKILESDGFDSSWTIASRVCASHQKKDEVNVATIVFGIRAYQAAFVNLDHSS